jgi:pilus assembly protein CpaE
MTKFALALETESAAPVGNGERHIAPVPRISIQAFCETTELAQAVQAAGADRRMAKAHIKAQMGGLSGAIEAYRSSATPNVIMVEHNGNGNDCSRASIGLPRSAMREPRFSSSGG